jgi:heme/copper-type cytochrome/quinol oxidase subunit 4
MESLPLLKKQILILFIFSLLATITSIIHGIFFDLDFSQIRRLTFEGFLLTLFVIFPAILFLEWVFDFNNKSKFDELEKKIKNLKNKKRD